MTTIAALPELVDGLEHDPSAGVVRIAEQATIVCGAHPDLLANLLAEDPDLGGLKARVLQLGDLNTPTWKLYELLRHRDSQEAREEIASLDSEYVMTVDYFPNGGVLQCGSSDLDPDVVASALVMLGYEVVAIAQILNGNLWLYRRVRPEPQYFNGSLAESARQLWERADQWTETEDRAHHWLSSVGPIFENGPVLKIDPYEDVSG